MTRSHGRFRLEVGTALYSGNELILKGMLEAGTGLITGYPGSPVADLFSIAAREAETLREFGIRAVQANNEAQAAAMLNGAQDAGVNAAAVMKSVGLHVAADALAIANYAGTSPLAGSIVVVGDDPSLSSTQVGVDSRWLLRHLEMPILAPSTFQEIKDWIGVGLDLSRSSGLVVGYWVTSPQAEGGGTVKVGANRGPRVRADRPAMLDTSAVNLDRRVNLPPNSNSNERDIHTRRRDLLHARAKALGVDVILGETGSAAVGMIASGACFTYLLHVIRGAGLINRVRLFKAGLVYPMDADRIRDFAQGLTDIYIVEEKGPFVETQVKAALEGCEVRIWGKKFRDGAGFPETGGLTPGLILKTIACDVVLRRLADPMSLRRELSRLDRGEEDRSVGERGGGRKAAPPAARRTPTFCPGCPHRETLSALKSVDRPLQGSVHLRTEQGESSGPILFHGDIGCYSMAFLPPFGTMHNLSGMGLGGATGAGADPFVTNPQVVLMGDSTFFHSGILSISNSIKENQNITYVILDNKNTAMTGHQGTAASDRNLMGERIPPQDIERIVRSLHPDLPLFRVNPSNRDDYVRLLDRIVRRKGVKVVVSDKECGITFHQKRRAMQRREVEQRGWLKHESHIQIVEEVCEFCLECTRATGCPGLTFMDTEYGPKVAIDRSTCVSDSYCTTIKACPSFEKVDIVRKAAAGRIVASLPEGPVPLRSFHFPWRMVAAGVGGLGLGVMNGILARAAERDGYRIHTMEKKGLAIRNGSVEAHLTLDRGEDAHSPVVPEGAADLLIGLDPLEAERALPYVHRGTVAVVNTHATLTVNALIGASEYPSGSVERVGRRTPDVRAFDFSESAEEGLGSKVYANLVALGSAYQWGLLPVTEASIISVLRESFDPAEAERNEIAFRLGRRISLDERRLSRSEAPESVDELRANRCRSIEHSFLIPWVGGRMAREFDRLIADTRDRLDVPEAMLKRFVRYAADLVEFDGVGLARDYSRIVLMVHANEGGRQEHAATLAVMDNLFRVFLIKDEVYVAHLLTREEKYRRDRERFRLSEGDRIRYSHFNRPRFLVWGIPIEFDLRTRDWMLRIMKHARWLRRLMKKWHAQEREFATWYVAEVIGSYLAGDFPDTASAHAALRAPEEVRGYREIRYARMAEAVEKVRNLRIRKAAGM